MPDALSVYQLNVNYDKTPVLWDISLNVPQGHLVGVVGPNGAGKSTFIKAAIDLLTPLSGRIEFFGQPLKNVRQRVGYVPQRESVDWDFPITVKELVLMGRYGRLGLFHWPRQADRDAADMKLAAYFWRMLAKRKLDPDQWLPTEDWSGIYPKPQPKAPNSTPPATKTKTKVNETKPK